DPADGHPIELGPGPSENERNYWLKLDDLAHDVADVIHLLEQSVGVPHTRKVVYLAETTGDFRSARAAIKDELERQEYTVVPDAPLPLDAEACSQFVREQLARSQCSVHPIGQHFGIVPEGTDHSFVMLQHEL